MKQWQPSWRIRWSLWAKKWFPVLAQVATVVISLAALVVIRKQAWIYDEQRKLMIETQRVLSEQTEITRVAQRAYVGVSSITADLKERQVIMLLENVGKIPADKIKVEVREARRNTTQSSLGSIQPIKYFEGQQLFPGSLKLQVVVPLDSFQSTEIADIAAKKETLYVSGTIDYQDGFGNQKTFFGFEYKPPPKESWITRSELLIRK